MRRSEEEARTGNTETSTVQLSRLDMVTLDELGYPPFARSGGRMLLHLVSKFYERTSAIATTNQSSGERTTVFGDLTMTTATLGRLTHHWGIVDTGSHHV